MNKLEILDKYKDVKSLDAIPLTEDYWKIDTNLCKELHRQNEELNNSIKMSGEKHHKRFTI